MRCSAGPQASREVFSALVPHWEAACSFHVLYQGVGLQVANKLCCIGCI